MYLWLTPSLKLGGIMPRKARQFLLFMEDEERKNGSHAKSMVYGQLMELVNADLTLNETQELTVVRLINGLDVVNQGGTSVMEQLIVATWLNSCQQPREG